MLDNDRCSRCRSRFEHGSRATFGGFVYGISAEAFLSRNIALRIEAPRYDYSEQTFSLPNAQNTVVTLDPSSDVIRAGISWRFN
jgi:hypothetical protein